MRILVDATLGRIRIVAWNAAHFANSPVPAFDIRDFLAYVHAA